MVHAALSRAPTTAAIAGLVGVYLLGVGSVLFAPEGSDVAVWWPAAGLSVALLVLAPPTWRVRLAVGVAVFSALANLTAGRTAPTAAAFGLANAAEAFVVAWFLLRHRRQRAALRTMDDLRRLTVATLLGNFVVGTGIGLTVAIGLGGSFGASAVAVMASHAAAILVFAPLALRVEAGPRRVRGEVLLQASLLLAMTAYIFWPGQVLSLTFLPLPLLLWASLRFGMRTISYELIALGVLTTTLTTLGGGPFTLGARTGVTSVATTASLVQAFLIVTALIALPLGVAVDQRRTALSRVTHSEELFRKSFSESFVGMLLLSLADDELRVREVNQTASHILDTPLDALEGRALQELFETNTSFADVAAGIAAGDLAGWREEMWLAGGRRRRVGLALSPVSTTSTEAVFSAQVIDITDAHVAGARLRAEKDFTAAVLNTTDCLIVVVEVDGTVVDMNPAATRATGYTEAELRGVPLWGNLFSSDDEGAVRDLLDHERPVSARQTTFEGDLHTSRGRRRRVIWSSAPLTGDDGRQTHAVLTGIDVTDERNVRSMSNHLLDSATATAFIGLNRRGLVTIFNTGAQELLGYSAEEVTGRLRLDDLHDRGELRRVAAETGTTADFAAIAAGAAERPQTRDWTYLRKDGTTVVCSVTVSAVRDAFGSHIGYLAVGRDVTEARHHQQILVEALDKEREAVERLQELDRAKSDFVSTVSHELRTPITSIVGYTEMLQEGAAGAVSMEQDRLLDAVRRNGERLIALIEDLLTLSRIEAGTFVLEKSPLDLRTVVARCEEALQPLLCGRRLEVTFTVPEEPVNVLGDQSQLERVVLNLVGNAVKFTEDGGRVTCALTNCGGAAEIEVADTGIGIPEEEQEALFTRFFRSTTAQKRAIQGTGLGLSIVQSIVHSHGGEIAISSQHLVGTRAAVQIPLVPAVRAVDAVV